MAIAGELVWVTVGAHAAPAGDALGGSCGPLIYGGSGRPDAIIVSDLPMGAGPRVPARQMADAISFILRAHRYRAGDRTIGYRACDDWSGATAVFDPKRCHSNGEAYAHAAPCWPSSDPTTRAARSLCCRRRTRRRVGRSR